MSSEQLEHHVSLTLRNALEIADLVDVIQVQGHRNPVEESVEEFLQFDLLAFEGRPSRRNTWSGIVRFQIRSISRMANQRADRSLDAPWILASRVRFLLAKQDLVVKNFDESDPPTVGTLQIKEATSVYEKVEGDPNLHAVVTTFAANLIQFT